MSRRIVTVFLQGATHPDYCEGNGRNSATRGRLNNTGKLQVLLNPSMVQPLREMTLYGMEIGQGRGGLNKGGNVALIQTPSCPKKSMASRGDAHISEYPDLEIASQLMRMRGGEAGLQAQPRARTASLKPFVKLAYQMLSDLLQFRVCAQIGCDGMPVMFRYDLHDDELKELVS